MPLSQSGVKFIAQFEGLRLSSYQDVRGIWTIGYGTTYINGKPVTQGMTCTQEQAEQWLAADTQVAETGVRRYLSGCGLTQNQLDALISFAYNVGVGAFQSSTLAKMIRAGQPVLEDYFTRWSKAKDLKTGQLVVVPGLLRRRQGEYNVYMSGVYDA
jgi:lysozyme